MNPETDGMGVNHRTPPKPEWYNETQPGICRWCGFQILRDGKPRWNSWHPECAVQFKRLFWPNDTRRQLLKLRGEKCEDCGRPLGMHAQWKFEDGGKRQTVWTAEHHHVVPLKEYPHDPEDPLAAWRETNLALLCHACHMARHHPRKPITADRQRRLF